MDKNMVVYITIIVWLWWLTLFAFFLHILIKSLDVYKKRKREHTLKILTECIIPLSNIYLPNVPISEDNFKVNYFGIYCQYQSGIIPISTLPKFKYLDHFRHESYISKININAMFQNVEKLNSEYKKNKKECLKIIKPF